MMSFKRWTPVGVLLCASLAACDAGPTASTHPVDPSVPEPVQLARLACTVTVASGAMQCRDAVSTGPAGGLLVGGQHKYVALAASNHAYDAGAEEFTIDVTVTNLIPQPLGTTDGTTLDPDGVKVFFYQEPHPTGGDMGASIEIEGTAQRGMILEPNQAYYTYNEVIGAGATSSPTEWQFGLPTSVTTFAFTVYVYAAVEFPDGWINLSETADTLVEGGASALTATVINAYGDTLPDPVTWSSSSDAIATVDGSGGVTAVAPGSATITATQGPRTGTMTLAVCPDLAVGEAYTAEMPAASSICFAGGASGAAEYTYMPVNLSASSALSLTLTGTGIQAVTGPPSPSLAPANGPQLGRAAAGPSSDDAAHLRTLQRSRGETARLMGRRDARISRSRASSAVTAGGRSFAITPGVPSVGDLWSLNVAQGCSGAADLRTGQVRSVGQHVIIVSDTANPAGGFTTAQYDSIALEFDTIAYPVDSANFGAPTDVDSNGRIVVFYTRAVNELSPPASSALTEGYFTNRDVFSTDPVSGCERSNAGEIIYMMVPDPTGAVNSNVRTVSFVRGTAIRRLGHELQHLINAFRRLYVSEATSFEEAWLDEGLSQVAEELMFYRTSVGLAPRGNIVLSNLNTGPNASRRVAAYNTYSNPNFTNFRAWLQRPDTTGAFKDNVTSASRGVSWAFLRYAADRVNGSDPAFWSALVDSKLEGKANIQNAIGADPNVWLRDFVSAVYADDNAFSVAAPQRTPSWNYRSVYGGLGGFPLGTRALSDGTPLTLSYSRGGGTAFGRFGVAQGAFAGVTALSGGVAPSSPYSLIVVRTK